MRKPPRSVRELEGLAYEILEDARLTCERLREREEHPACRRVWSDLHHDFGVAAYYAVAELEPRDRRRAAALAWESSLEPSASAVENAVRIRDGLARVREILAEVGRSEDTRDHREQVRGAAAAAAT